MKKIDNNLAVKILLFLIITIQVVSIVFATSNREYYHIDEYYSHGLMQYENAFIFDNEDFMNEWHDKEYYADYLTIGEEEKNDFSSVYENQVADVHPPLYYLLLRIACSFNIGNFSVWPGTILNIIIFIIASIFLFLIAKEIFKNSYYALLVCFVAGFSIATIETVMYVRMYELLVLNILLLIYWHIRKSKKDILTFKDMIPLFLMVVVGFLTHYYYCIIVATLFIMYMLRFIKKKQISNVFKYVLTLVASALTGLAIFPHAINHIFFSYRGQGVTSSIFDLSTILMKFGGNLQLIETQIFNYNGKIVLGLGIAIALILAIKLITNNKKSISKPITDSGVRYVAIPTVVYLVIAILGSPYVDTRYLMPVITLIFCLLIYIAKDMLEDICSKKTAFNILVILVILFNISVIPELTNNIYSCKGYDKVLIPLETELHDKPMICVYYDVSVQYNKIMEAYEAFTLVDNTYIMPKEEFSKENVDKVLKQINAQDGCLVMINRIDKEEVVKELTEDSIFTTATCYGNLGRFLIYEFK